MYYYYCVFCEGEGFQGIVYAENCCHAADMLTNFYGDKHIDKMQIECACEDFVFEMEMEMEEDDEDDLPF